MRGRVIVKKYHGVGHERTPWEVRGEDPARACFVAIARRRTRREALDVARAAERDGYELPAWYREFRLRRR